VRSPPTATSACNVSCGEDMMMRQPCREHGRTPPLQRPMLAYGTGVMSAAMTAAGLVLMLSKVTDHSPDLAAVGSFHVSIRLWGALLTISSLSSTAVLYDPAWKLGLAGAAVAGLVASFLTLTLAIESLSSGHGELSGVLLFGYVMLYAGECVATYHEHRALRR
jgi:hypothetical protein